MSEIHYSIPSGETHHAQTKVSITDMMGRELIVLVNAEQAGGEYEVPFEWQKLSNGTYYVMIDIDGVRSFQMKSILK